MELRCVTSAPRGRQQSLMRIFKSPQFPNYGEATLGPRERKTPQHPPPQQSPVAQDNTFREIIFSMDSSGRLKECDPTAAGMPKKRSRRRAAANTSAVATSPGLLPIPRTTTRRQSQTTNAIAGPSSETLQGPTKDAEPRRERLPRKRRPARAPRTVRGNNLPELSQTTHPDLTYNDPNEASTSVCFATSTLPQEVRQGHSIAGPSRQTRHSVPYPATYEVTRWQEYARFHPYEAASLYDARQPESKLLPQPEPSRSWSTRRYTHSVGQADSFVDEYDLGADRFALPAGPGDYSQVAPHDEMPRHTETSVAYNDHYSVQGISNGQRQSMPILSSYSSLSNALGEGSVAMPLGPQDHAALAAPPPTPPNAVEPETQHGNLSQQTSAEGGNPRQHPYARPSNVHGQRGVEAQARPTSSLVRAEWPPFSTVESWQRAEYYQDDSLGNIAAPYTSQSEVLSYASPVASGPIMQHQYHDAVVTTHPVDYTFDDSVSQATVAPNEVPLEFLPADRAFASYETDPAAWAPQVGSSADASFYAAGEEAQAYVPGMPGLQEYVPSMMGSADVASIPWNSTGYPPAYDLYSSYLDMLSFDTYGTSFQI